MLIGSLEKELQGSKAGPWEFKPSVNEKFLVPGLRSDGFGKRTGPLVGKPHVMVGLRAWLNEKNPYGIKQNSVLYHVRVAITEDGGSIYKTELGRIQEVTLAKVVSDAVQWITKFEVEEIGLIAFRKQLETKPTPVEPPSSPIVQEINAEAEFNRLIKGLKAIADDISKTHPLSGPYEVTMLTTFDRSSESGTIYPSIGPEKSKYDKYKAHVIFPTIRFPYLAIKVDTKGVWCQYTGTANSEQKWIPVKIGVVVAEYRKSWTKLADAIEKQAFEIEQQLAKEVPTPPREISDSEILEDLKDAINTVSRRLGWERDPAEIDGKTVFGMYRSKIISKEVEYREEEDIELEIESANNILKKQIGHLQNRISYVDIQHEDKDWISITIRIK